MMIGVYVNYYDSICYFVLVFIFNVIIWYIQGFILGMNFYWVGLKMMMGWVYVEGFIYIDENEKD